MELTISFMVLLDTFQPVFTSPSFDTFRRLMSGWILSHRHRYVTDLIISSDSVGQGHYSDYHRFFSHARWVLDQLWKLLAGQLVRHLVGPDAVILLAGDDTLCRKRGLGLFGGGMHHDPLISSRKMKLVSWGHDWVTLCLVIIGPWWAPSKVFALPICMRLYRNRQGLTKGLSKSKAKQGSPSRSKTRTNSQQRADQKGKEQTAARHKTQKAGKIKGNPGHRTRPELMREMLELVAGWFPHRRFLFVGDSLYTGESVLRYLPETMDMIGQVHPTGAMYEPAPQEQSRRGPRRKKGQRLSSRDEWAADRSRWKRLKFDQYGLHATLETKTRTGLYYKAGQDRLLRFVLSRDTEGGRPTQIFYCTDLSLDVGRILSMYAARWSIEVTHHDAKQFLGLKDPANRLPLAVQRTAPMAMFLYSLTILWYALGGYEHVQFPNRPWYRRKAEPSFADMLTTLRRLSWQEQISPVRQNPRLLKKAVDHLIHMATLAG